MVYDRIRKQWVVGDPEEKVRQRVLDYLIEKLGYPESYIVVERQLSDLATSTHIQKMPVRRIDILCCEAHTARPLFLIECKSGGFTDQMAAQLLGYNAYIKAPAIALVNESKWQMLSDNYSHQRPPINVVPNYESFFNRR